MLFNYKMMLKCLVRSTENNFYSLKYFSSSENGILVEKMGAVTTLAINNPDNKNLLEEGTYKELCSAVQSFQKDESSVVAVLFGVGGNFCSGCASNFVPDINQFLLPKQKPIVAGLTGYATGFGFELALLCDLRVIERTAQMGQNGQPSRLSQVAYERLVSIVGLAHALDITLTGRNVHCKEAALIGLANRHVDCGTGVGQAIQLGKSIAKFPSSVLLDVKQGVYSVLQNNNG